MKRKTRFGFLVLLGIFLLLNVGIGLSYAGEVTSVDVWLNRYQNEYSDTYYGFYTDVWGTYTEFESIILTSPLNETYSLSLSSEGDQWGCDYEGKQSEIESEFIDGTYTFYVTYKDGTSESVNAELSGTLPEFPANLSRKDNLVTWDEWVSPISPFSIEIEIGESNGEDIIWEELPYTDTSFIIPEGFLKCDTSYDLELWFVSSEHSTFKSSVSTASFHTNPPPSEGDDGGGGGGGCFISAINGN